MKASDQAAILDAHCHLPFLNSKALHLWSTQVKTGDRWLMGGYDPGDWQAQRNLCHRFPDQVHSSFGLHPWFVISDQFRLEDHLKLLSDSLVGADLLGEVGLDFALPKQRRQTDLQREVFARQLALAPLKPRVLHVVKAHTEAQALLRAHAGSGLVHAFQGDAKVASGYMDLGYKISIGPHTLKLARAEREALIKWLPSHALLVESDSPSRRGGEQSPRDLWLQVAKQVAEIRGLRLEALHEVLHQNLADLLQTGRKVVAPNR